MFFANNQMNLSIFLENNKKIDKKLEKSSDEW